MNRLTALRRLLIVSVSAAALTIGAQQAEAQTPPRPPLVIPKDSWTLFAQGLQYFQTDGGYDYGPPLGKLKPLKGIGASLGLVYQPALSPWSFGVSAHWGKTHKKRKSVRAQHTTTQQFQHQHTHTTSSSSSPSSSTPTTTPTSSTTTPPNSALPQAGNVISTTTTTTTVVKHTVNRKSASREASHFILDFTVGRDVGLGNLPSGDPILKLEAGIRFARLNDKGEFASTSSVQSSTIGGSPVGSSVSSRRFNGRRRFTGAGPRLGFTFAAPLIGNFTLDGTGGAALLYGRTTEERTFLTDGVVTSQSKSSENHFVPGFDASLALSYWVTPQAKLSLGYSVEGYYNAFPSASFAGVPSFSQDKNMLIHGPFARATVKF